jgi:hypothetical protein
MRVADSTIKQAILHPENEVRWTALYYFSYCPDESLMPLVIQAAEQYGPREAIDLLRESEDLPQTETTIQWLTGELAKQWNLEDTTNDNYCYLAASVLCRARVDLLRPEMADLPSFPQELKTCLLERLEMAAWDWDTGWAELLKVGETFKETRSFPNRETERARRIIESLAKHKDKAASLPTLLNRNWNEEEAERMMWVEPMLIELAGKMRAEETVPILVKQLTEGSFMVEESIQAALKDIGGDRVVEEIDRFWPDGDREFRLSTAEILENIHTELSAKNCVDYFSKVEDEVVKSFLVDAMLGNFVLESVELVRKLLLEDEEASDADEIKNKLVAVCTIADVRFPEYDQWYKEAVEDKWGWKYSETERFRVSDFTESEDAFSDEDDFDEEEYDDDYDDDDYDDDDCDDDDEIDASWLLDENRPSPPDDDRIEPFVNERKPVGRNDPCPCGSGKKFKKCCLNKKIEE